jgi:hypothetical protein
MNIQTLMSSNNNMNEIPTNILEIFQNLQNQLVEQGNRFGKQIVELKQDITRKGKQISKLKKDNVKLKKDIVDLKYRMFTLEYHVYLIKCVEVLIEYWSRNNRNFSKELPEIYQKYENKFKEINVNLNVVKELRNTRNEMVHPKMEKKILLTVQQKIKQMSKSKMTKVVKRSYMNLIQAVIDNELCSI